MQSDLSIDGCKSEIPKHILDRLAEPPPYGEGSGRHDDISWLTGQLAAERWSEEEIFPLIRERYADQPDKKDVEIRNLIRGAYKLGYQPVATSRKAVSQYGKNAPAESVTVKRLVVDTSLPAPNVPSVEMSAWQFVKSMFKPGEVVCIETPSDDGYGDKITGSGTYLTVEEWEVRLSEEYTEDFGLCERERGFYKKQEGESSVIDELNRAPFGVHIRINPVKPDSRNGQDASVADYRNLLVEFDQIPKAEQWRILNKSKLPIRCVLDSGGKSLHALVAVDADGPKQFKDRQEAVYNFLGDYPLDQQNKNPARFSRLPGVRRNDKDGQQKFVSGRIGAATWADWEEANTDDGLPDIQSPEEFLKERMELDPYLIVSLLRENSKMSMTSQSKAGKTWLLLWLALCVGSGRPWLGNQCEKQPVLYVNLELKSNGLNNRVYDICEGMSLDPVNGHLVDFWNMRGKSADIQVMTERIIRRIKSKTYKLVIIDPGYKCLGWRDENKAGDITDFQNHVERICTEVGAAVIVVGHTPKGDISNRAANDRQSGSGVWARDPDVVASFVQCADADIIEKHGNDVVVVSFSGMREDVTPKPFLAKWEFPILKRLEDELPKKAKKMPDRAQKVLSVLGDKGMSWEDLFKSCKNDHGASKATFNRALEDLEKFSAAEKVDGVWRKIQPNTFSFGDSNEI